MREKRPNRVVHGGEATSPPACVARARYKGKSMLSRMNRTEPSANAKFSPPGWRLRKPEVFSQLPGG